MGGNLIGRAGRRVVEIIKDVRGTVAAATVAARTTTPYVMRCVRPPGVVIDSSRMAPGQRRRVHLMICAYN